MLTEQEKIVLEKSKELWNEFLKLPVEHYADTEEFCIHIHALQNMVACRVGFRELNKTEDGKPSLSR